MIASNHPDTHASIPKPLSIMGIPVVPFESYSHAVTCVEESMTSGRKSFWVAINPQKIYRALHDAKLRAILNQADAGICDGIGVSIASKLLYDRFLNRCTGCDLFFELLSIAARKGWKVFLLGATPESNEKACRTLRERYPGLRIVGRQDGYFRDSAAVVEQINASQADLLFVAMGSPKQEYWIWEHRDAINAAFCMGVGGSLDVVSGKIKRAPKLFRSTGTEFLFQLATEPSRWRRQVVYAPYMLKVFREKLFGRSAFARPRGGADAGKGAEVSDGP
jgi:N-acetylglucosaminyldiphosphoundecaprenol N-acetyl-beta-D-mannosaminyltransferase